ncbi:MAG: aromatic amino acid lyase, partial [Salinivirgaceae bacterium]|nr:aromatic amino acid lyase [Salinivirgaceae bacterium]
MAAKQKINLESLYGILFEKKKLILSADDLKIVDNSFLFLKDFSKDKIIYGINTGFGPMAQYRVDDQSLIDLQYNIIRSHSTGAGKP